MEQYGATIDPTNRYRYNLWRRLPGGTKGTVLFVMLNPSIAHAHLDDPTIRRCIGFGERMSFSKLMVCNLYAYRATDPRNLAKAEEPVGLDNLTYLEREAQNAEVVIAAWGANKMVTQMGGKVLDVLSDYRDVMCLGKTKNGYPKHPLYLRADAPLQLYYSKRSGRARA